MYWVLCLLLVFDAFSLRETVVLRFCHFQGLISSFGETCNLDAECIETVNHNVFHIQKQYLIVFFYHFIRFNRETAGLDMTTPC